jgi:proteasome accessory factor B
MTRGDPKLQRWLDLIAALLRHRFPVSFRTLAEEVPQYRSMWAAYEAAAKPQTTALSRMFERDKEELRALGVPLATTMSESGSQSEYMLHAHDFYLPFLHCAQYGSSTERRGTKRAPSRTTSVPTKSLTPDTIALLVAAAQRVQRLGDPALTEAGARALQTLSFDLTAVRAPVDDGATIVAPAPVPALGPIADALADGYAIECEYYSIGRNATATRQLEPLGLAFTGGHWYCVAQESSGSPVKNFRVSRMHRVKSVGKAHAVVPPAGFSLDAHAESRRAWELGDGDQTIVRIRVAPGVDEALLPSTRRSATSREWEVPVRRIDPFLRWLLHLGGEVRPVAPDDVVASWRSLIADTIVAGEAV